MKKMYNNPQTEAVELNGYALMDTAAMSAGSSVPGVVGDAPARGTKPF